MMPSDVARIATLGQWWCEGAEEQRCPTEELDRSAPGQAIAGLLKRVGVLMPSDIELAEDIHGPAGEGDASPEEG